MEKMRKRALMWVLMLVTSIILAYFVDSYFDLSSLGIYSRILGLVLIVFSYMLLRASGKALKRFGMKTKRGFGETDTLVTTGIYGCIRHPHHTGIAMFIVGFGFLFASPSFLLIFVPLLLLAVYTFVKRIEEPEAIKKFGNAYIEYSKRVPAFIPRQNCFNRKKSE